MKKIGIIVQRYGLEINGGAEYHARLIAEKIAGFYDVEVFTTTAIDYITWEHYYKAEKENINGIIVNRFKVEKPRDPVKFGKIQNVVFNEEHSSEDEMKWLHEEGPFVPELINSLEKRSNEFSYFIFFSYRYYLSYYGVNRFTKKAILVPTAEHDEVVYMRLFKNLFNLPAAIIYNSVEEKEIINRVSGNYKVPGDIVGVGSEIPEKFDPESFRKKFNIKSDYILYIGRLDENKGVPEFLGYFTRYLNDTGSNLNLVLIGKSYVDIPENPNIVHLGFLSDKDKFDALKGTEFLVIPSQYESLSMVTLEAWALEKPVIANGRTEVLKGQCSRSNAGLWYCTYDEFKHVVSLLSEDVELRKKMGMNGKKYFNTNYSWKVITQKYTGLINKLENNK